MAADDAFHADGQLAREVVAFDVEKGEHECAAIVERGDAIGRAGALQRRGSVFTDFNFDGGELPGFEVGHGGDVTAVDERGRPMEQQVADDGVTGFSLLHRTGGAQEAGECARHGGTDKFQRGDRGEPGIKRGGTHGFYCPSSMRPLRFSVL